LPYKKVKVENKLPYFQKLNGTAVSLIFKAYSGFLFP